MINKSTQIYLASKSPRRQALLNQMGLLFEVQEIDVNESVNDGESGYEYVDRIATAKSRAGHLLVKNKRIPVLGADTCIVFNEEIIGKPRDKKDAIDILKKLSGNQHRVLTAIALSNESKCLSKVQASKVFFKDLSDEEINAYVESDEPRGKAGAYAIQGLGAKFINNIEGSYSGIMGLPIFETAELLNEFNLSVNN